MITIISSTNRPNSNSRKVAETLASFYNQQGLETSILDLAELPHEYFFPDMYAKGSVHPSMVDVLERYLTPADRLHFVIPEYNGTFPGVLKLWIDAISVVGDFKVVLAGKKAALTGLAAGRAGNLRGLDHFTTVLNYLNVNVMPNKLPVSSFGQLLNAEKKLEDAGTLKALEAQVAEFLKY